MFPNTNCLYSIYILSLCLTNLPSTSLLCTLPFSYLCTSSASCLCTLTPTSALRTNLPSASCLCTPIPTSALPRQPSFNFSPLHVYFLLTLHSAPTFLQLFSSAPSLSPTSALQQPSCSFLPLHICSHFPLHLHSSATPLTTRPPASVLPITHCLYKNYILPLHCHSNLLRLLSSATSLSPTSLHICCHPSLHLQSSATPLIARPPATVFRITPCRYMLKPCLCRAVPTFLQHLSSPPPSSTSSQPQPQPQPFVPEPHNHLRPYLPYVPVLTHISASVHPTTTFYP